MYNPMMNKRIYPSYTCAVAQGNNQSTSNHHPNVNRNRIYHDQRNNFPNVVNQSYAPRRVFSRQQPQQFPNHGGKQLYNTSPGSVLFFHLKNYTNNLYSYELMKLDINLNGESPRKTKEFFRVLDSLNRTQVQLKKSEASKKQWLKLECLAHQLCVESTRLALIDYESKKDEILCEIHRCFSQNIKYIPSHGKIINYVLPNMRKRRFFEQIFPLVSKEMDMFLHDLCRRMGYQITPEKGMHLPNKAAATNPKCPLLSINAQEATINTNQHSRHSSISSLHATIEITEDAPMDLSIEDSNNKRKRPRDTSSNISYSPCSSIADISRNQNDNSISSPRCSNNRDKSKRTNRIRTVEEAYTKLKTFAPSNHQLPTLAKVSDTADLAILNEKNTSEMDVLSKETLMKNASLSAPHYSLVTLHGEEHQNVDILSHVKVKISTNTLENLHMLNKFPLETNILYELYLTNETYKHFRHSLLNFVINAEHINFPFIVTVPAEKGQDITELLGHINLQEINHPFRNAQGITLIT
jgi:hypothetical protein